MTETLTTRPMTLAVAVHTVMALTWLSEADARLILRTAKLTDQSVKLSRRFTIFYGDSSNKYFLTINGLISLDKPPGANKE